MIIRSLLVAAALTIVSIPSLQGSAQRTVVSASRFLSQASAGGIGAGNNILFPDEYSDEMGGVSYNDLSGEFLLPAGFYKISYGASAAGQDTAPVPGIELVLGDTPVAGSRLFFTPAVDPNALESQVIYIAVPKNGEASRTLSLRVVANGASNTFTFPANGQDGRVAYISIKQVGKVQD